MYAIYVRNIFKQFFYIVLQCVFIKGWRESCVCKCVCVCTHCFCIYCNVGEIEIKLLCVGKYEQLYKGQKHLRMVGPVGGWPESHWINISSQWQSRAHTPIPLSPLPPSPPSTSPFPVLSPRGSWLYLFPYLSYAFLACTNIHSYPTCPFRPYSLSTSIALISSHCTVPSLD